MIEGTEGELALDISSLRARTGLITLTPASATPGLQERHHLVDGENGHPPLPRHPDRAARGTVELRRDGFLLIYGHLPTTRASWISFEDRLTANAALHESFKHHFEGFPVDAPPMAMLSAMVNTLACFYPRVQQLDRGGIRRGGGVAAEQEPGRSRPTRYRRSLGLPFIYPDPGLSYAGDFLHMMFSLPLERVRRQPRDRRGARTWS